jgi:NAD(P)-dependent dehydrogenase (short-subunit alcohol dehydrogenase family)
MTDPGRVAVVTGVGGGIGRSVALGLARDGCDVALAARTRPTLEVVAAEVEALGRRALVVPTDTGDGAQCRALVEQAVAEFGRLDVLVSSAASGGPNRTIVNSDLADWQRAWEVNVLGPLELCRAAIPHFRAVGGGAIVAVSTLAVRAINPGQGAYAATKGALQLAMQTLAKEIGPEGVRVNVVLPGFVPGPNTDDMFARQAEQRGVMVDEVVAQYAKGTALRRLPTPDDLADAVVFLASERARSITGQTLDVNSGAWLA